MPAPLLPVQRRRWTIAEVEALADAAEDPGDRYELVDGELLVTPAPSNRHQRIVGELFLLLADYVRRHKLGEVRLGPGRAPITRKSLLEPDICVVADVNGQRPRADARVAPLRLVAEVLSPGSIRHDRMTKRRFYQRQGISEYWIVDGDSETFEIWTPDNDRPSVIDDRIVWQPVADVPPLEIDVAAFFKYVADPPL